MVVMACISRSRRRRAVSGGSPGSRQIFFWSVMIVSARCNFRCSRRFSALELGHPRVDGARRRPAAAPAHLPQGARLTLPPPVRQERRVQPLATQQGTHLAGFLARVNGLENAQPIRGREAPPLDRRRYLRVRGTGRRRGRGVAASGRPPGSLHPGPAPTSTSTASGMRVISPTSPAPTLNSTGRLSHRLLAQGGVPARRLIKRSGRRGARHEQAKLVDPQCE